MWKALRQGQHAVARGCAESRNRLRLAQHLNAFVDVFDNTSIDASAANLPLHGLPVAIKANLLLEGKRATAASKMLSEYIAPMSATCVQRLQAAGATIVGTTNMDEFAMGSHTQFSAHGNTYSPYSPAVSHVWNAPFSTEVLSSGLQDASGVWTSAGGSSGGSAVAVASGSVFAALGTDTGGSVRQPAAFCGVVGFKPTYGSIPRWGMIAFASSLDTVGVLARNVDDAALVFDIIRGYDGLDDTARRLPPQTAQELIRENIDSASYVHPSSEEAPIHDLRGVRIGIPREVYVKELSPVIADHWDRVAKGFYEMGAEIVPISVPSAIPSVTAYYLVAPAEASSNLARYDGVKYGLRVEPRPEDLKSNDSSAAAALHAMYTATRTAGFGMEVKSRLLMGTFALSEGSRGDYYEAALALRARLCDEFSSVFRFHDVEKDPLDRMFARVRCRAAPAVGVDAILLPTSPVLAPHCDDVQNHDPIQAFLHDLMTIPASMAQLPAVSVPVALAQTESTRQHPLPVGMQIVGRPFDERTVLRLASCMQQYCSEYTTPPFLQGLDS